MNITENRRQFLLNAAGSLAAAGVLFPHPGRAAARRMKIDLHTGNIGVKANLQQQIAYASKYGFEAVDPNINELAALSDSAWKEMSDGMAAGNLVFGFLAQSVPVSQADAQFAEWTRTTLTGWAKILQRANMPRFCTWLNPSDGSLTYLQNFKRHTRRLTEVAAVLGDYGVRFGLEYVGPKTSWAARKYPFIHTMESMKELIAEIGKSNVGFLLDSWHWHNSGETPADILTLQNRDVVAVHLNDAPKDVPIDQLRDGQREIPLATGVIDTAGFVNALNRIGYDGPIAAEPLGAGIRSLPPDEAVATIARVMKQAVALIA